MGTIRIQKLKGISKLVFEVPSESGVFLIAGANGCGKTTLLTTLDRICNHMAFAYGFSASSAWESADQYSEAVIEYSAGGKNVSYRKARERWSPTPKSGGNKVFSEFGFSSSVFIRADSKRIEAKKEDLHNGNIIGVDVAVKETLNNLFETTKYDQLQRLKNSYGRGKRPVVFYLIREKVGAKTTYFSEKRFSTGELAMVRMVEQIESVAKDAMILLDEAELALHPKVQVKMLDYLRKKSKEKNLRVFISTHSPTLLKSANAKEIYLLREDNEGFSVVNPCYSAQAIGDVDISTSNIFDYVFFVEDVRAQTILKRFRERFVKKEPAYATALCDIIPVGGYMETAKLAVRTEQRVFGDSVVMAVVDHDACEDDHKKAKEYADYKEKHKGTIKELPFTPELWLIEKMENATTALKQGFLRKYSVEIKTVLSDDEYTKQNSPKPRKLAKAKWDAICKYLADLTSETEEVIANQLIEMIVDDQSDGEVSSVMGPLFR